MIILSVITTICICVSLFVVAPGNWVPIAAVSLLPFIIWLLTTDTGRLVYLLILLIPVSVPQGIIEGFVIGFPSEALGVALLLFMLIASAVNKRQGRSFYKHPLVVLMIVEVLWMVFCAVTSVDPAVGLKRVFMRFLFLQLYFFYGIRLFTNNKSGYHLLHILYATGLLIPITSAIIFHSKFDFIPPAAYKMCSPYYADHTIYGASIAFVIPMLLVLTFGNRTIQLKRLLHTFVVLLTVVTVTAVVLSFSRAAWVSLIVSGFFALLIRLRISLRGLLAMLTVIGITVYVYNDDLFSYISKNDAISNKGDISDHLLSATNVQSDASNTERINRWVCAWKIATERPLTGCGPGMYQFTYGKYQETFRMTRISTFSGNRGHAHSEFFTQLSETGFPGGLLFIVIVLTSIGYGLKVIYQEKKKRLRLLLYGTVIGLMTFYIHGVFNAFLDTDKMAVLVFGSLSIIVAADIRQRGEKSSGNSTQLDSPGVV